MAADRLTLREALELVRDCSSQEWQQPDGKRMGATDNSGRRMWFITEDVMQAVRDALGVLGMQCHFCTRTNDDAPICVTAEAARNCPRGVSPCHEAQPVAWLHEFTDPHDGTRRRATWMNQPRDYDLQPGDTVTPLYTASGVTSTREPELAATAHIGMSGLEVTWHVQLPDGITHLYRVPDGVEGRERKRFTPGDLEYASWFTASAAYMADCAYCGGDCPSPQSCGRAERLSDGVALPDGAKNG